jgi:hypothetical protein
VFVCQSSTKPADIQPVPGLPPTWAHPSGTIWVEDRSTGSAVWKQIKSHPTKKGYLQVPVCGRKYYVHRLVLLAFVGPCPAGMQCCHENDKHDDNRLENLRWDTPKANSRDAKRNGLVPHGPLPQTRKLTDEMMPLIRQLRKEGWSLRRLGHRFSVSDVAILKSLRRPI